LWTILKEKEGLGEDHKKKMSELELTKPMNELALFQERFNVHLKSIVGAQASATSDDTENPSVLDNVNHAKEIILGPGKRIRPYISYLMYKSLGGQDDEEALKLFAGIEIFHSFGLVHDDIIDNGKLRHGQTTSHVYIANQLKKENNRSGNLEKAGKNQAIIIGDLLSIWSQGVINLNEYFDPKKMQRIRKIFYQMAKQVAAGQMVDIDITTRTNVPIEEIDEKTRLKTAGYSFIKPLQIGAALAGNETKEVEIFCKEFGLAMGIAFQVQDDLLDMTSSDDKLGKTTSSDKSQNQHTYFTYFPSLEYGKKIISTNFEKARSLIKNLSIDESEKKKFFDLVEIIQNRTF